MILTRSELAKMTELFDAQELPDTFPDDLEFSFLEVLAPTMTLQDYLAMPEQERRKWWISSQIMEPIPLTGPDLELLQTAQALKAGECREDLTALTDRLFAWCRDVIGQQKAI